MIESAPMEVGTRGRLYTNTRQRRQLGLDGYGQGTSVQVLVESVDRSPDWGVHVESAAFDATLGAYGEVHVPVDARDTLDLDAGDAVRVSMQTVE